MLSEEEFYRDEHPHEEEPGSGGGSEDGSYDWGESWGSGGGGGGGSSGAWGYGWGSGAGSSAGDDDEMKAEWGGEEKEKSPVPILKRASGGSLLTHGNFLLHGLGHCERQEQIFIFIPPDADIRHLDCALYRITDANAKRALSATVDPENRLIRLYAAWGRPGRFQLELKWQRGHYDHAECGQMRVNAFGIELGWRTFALSRWSVAADIRIMPDYTVTVNNLKGNLHPENIL